MSTRRDVHGVSTRRDVHEMSTPQVCARTYQCPRGHRAIIAAIAHNPFFPQSPPGNQSGFPDSRPAMTTDYFKNKKDIPDSAPLPRPSSYGEDPPEPKSGAAEPSEYARKWFIYYAKIFQGKAPLRGLGLSVDPVGRWQGVDPGAHKIVQGVGRAWDEGLRSSHVCGHMASENPSLPQKGLAGWRPRVGSSQRLLQVQQHPLMSSTRGSTRGLSIIVLRTIRRTLCTRALCTRARGTVQKFSKAPTRARGTVAKALNPDSNRTVRVRKEMGYLLSY